MTTQTDGEEVLKEMVEATDPATVRCLGLTHYSLPIDGIHSIAAHVDHLQSALKESIRLQGEYAAEVERLKAENKELREALTPSGRTKALHSGEYKFWFSMPYQDENSEDDENGQNLTVPWTTVKQIMKAISDDAARASLHGKEKP